MQDKVMIQKMSLKINSNASEQPDFTCKTGIKFMVYDSEQATYTSPTKPLVVGLPHLRGYNRTAIYHL